MTHGVLGAFELGRGVVVTSGLLGGAGGVGFGKVVEVLSEGVVVSGDITGVVVVIVPVVVAGGVTVVVVSLVTGGIMVVEVPLSVGVVVESVGTCGVTTEADA